MNVCMGLITDSLPVPKPVNWPAARLILRLMNRFSARDPRGRGRGRGRLRVYPRTTGSDEGIFIRTRLVLNLFARDCVCGADPLLRLRRLAVALELSLIHI